MQGTGKGSGQEENVIRAYIAREVLFSGDEYPYADATSFLDEGVVDSMNVLQIVTFVEQRFCIRVSDDEIVPGNFDSVAALAAYVRSKAPIPADARTAVDGEQNVAAGSSRPSGGQQLRMV
jgi:acyl carrier protein